MNVIVQPDPTSTSGTTWYYSYTGPFFPACSVYYIYIFIFVPGIALQSFNLATGIISVFPPKAPIQFFLFSPAIALYEADMVLPQSCRGGFKVHCKVMPTTASNGLICLCKHVKIDYYYIKRNSYFIGRR